MIIIEMDDLFNYIEANNENENEAIENEANNNLFRHFFPDEKMKRSMCQCIDTWMRVFVFLQTVGQNFQSFLPARLSSPQRLSRTIFKA